jgi:hypothetical protein
MTAPVCCAPVASGPMSDVDALQIALRLKALADPVRVKIVSYLFSPTAGEEGTSHGVVRRDYGGSRFRRLRRCSRRPLRTFLRISEAETISSQRHLSYPRSGMLDYRL